MFIGISSLDRWLSVSRLDHDSFLIIKVGNQVKAFFSVTLGIQLLSSLKLFIHLLRSFKEVYIHLGLLCHNLTIWTMFLLREVKTDGKIIRTNLWLHHTWHSHHALSALHIWVLNLHKLMHTRVAHHKARIHPSSCHHHFLRRSSQIHAHLTHQHLIIRVPHLSMHRLILLNDINWHREKAKLTSKS